MPGAAEPQAGELLKQVASFAILIDNLHNLSLSTEPSTNRVAEELQRLRTGALCLLDEQLRVPPPWLQLRVKQPQQKILTGAQTKIPLTLACKPPAAVRLAIFQKQVSDLLQQPQATPPPAPQPTTTPDLQAQPEPVEPTPDQPLVHTPADQVTTTQQEAAPAPEEPTAGSCQAAEPTAPPVTQQPTNKASTRLISPFFFGQTERLQREPELVSISRYDAPPQGVNASPAPQQDPSQPAPSLPFNPSLLRPLTSSSGPNTTATTATVTRTNSRSLIRGPTYRERVIAVENSILEAEINAIQEDSWGEEQAVCSSTDTAGPPDEQDTCLSLVQSQSDQHSQADNMDTSARPSGDEATSPRASLKSASSTRLSDRRPPPIDCPSSPGSPLPPARPLALEPPIEQQAAAATAGQRQTGAGSDRSDQSRTNRKGGVPMYGPVKPDMQGSDASGMSGGTGRDQVGPLQRGMSRNNTRSRGTGDLPPAAPVPPQQPLQQQHQAPHASAMSGGMLPGAVGWLQGVTAPQNGLQQQGSFGSDMPLQPIDAWAGSALPPGPGLQVTDNSSTWGGSSGPSAAQSRRPSDEPGGNGPLQQQWQQQQQVPSIMQDLPPQGPLAKAMARMRTTRSGSGPQGGPPIQHPAYPPHYQAAPLPQFQTPATMPQPPPHPPRMPGKHSAQPPGATPTLHAGLPHMATAPMATPTLHHGPPHMQPAGPSPVPSGLTGMGRHTPGMSGPLGTPLMSSGLSGTPLLSGLSGTPLLSGLSGTPLHDPSLGYASASSSFTSTSSLAASSHAGADGAPTRRAKKKPVMPLFLKTALAQQSGRSSVASDSDAGSETGSGATFSGPTAGLAVGTAQLACIEEELVRAPSPLLETTAQQQNGGGSGGGTGGGAPGQDDLRPGLVAATAAREGQQQHQEVANGSQRAVAAAVQHQQHQQHSRGEPTSDTVGSSVCSSSTVQGPARGDGTGQGPASVGEPAMWEEQGPPAFYYMQHGPGAIMPDAQPGVWQQQQKQYDMPPHMQHVGPPALPSHVGEVREGPLPQAQAVGGSGAAGSGSAMLHAQVQLGDQRSTKNSAAGSQRPTKDSATGSQHSSASSSSSDSGFTAGSTNTPSAAAAEQLLTSRPTALPSGTQPGEPNASPWPQALQAQQNNTTTAAAPDARPAGDSAAAWQQQQPEQLQQAATAGDPLQMHGSFDFNPHNPAVQRPNAGGNDSARAKEDELRGSVADRAKWFAQQQLQQTNRPAGTGAPAPPAARQDAQSFNGWQHGAQPLQPYPVQRQQSMAVRTTSTVGLMSVYPSNGPTALPQGFNPPGLGRGSEQPVRALNRQVSAPVAQQRPGQLTQQQAAGAPVSTFWQGGPPVGTQAAPSPGHYPLIHDNSWGPSGMDRPEQQQQQQAQAYQSDQQQPYRVDQQQAQQPHRPGQPQAQPYQPTTRRTAPTDERPQAYRTISPTTGRALSIPGISPATFDAAMGMPPRDLSPAGTAGQSRSQPVENPRPPAAPAAANGPRPEQQPVLMSEARNPSPRDAAPYGYGQQPASAQFPPNQQALSQHASPQQAASVASGSTVAPAISAGAWSSQPSQRAVSPAATLAGSPSSQQQQVRPVQPPQGWGPPGVNMETISRRSASPPTNTMMMASGANSTATTALPPSPPPNGVPGTSTAHQMHLGQGGAGTLDRRATGSSPRAAGYAPSLGTGSVASGYDGMRLTGAGDDGQRVYAGPGSVSGMSQGRVTRVTSESQMRGPAAAEMGVEASLEGMLPHGGQPRAYEHMQQAQQQRQVQAMNGMQQQQYAQMQPGGGGGGIQAQYATQMQLGSGNMQQQHFASQAQSGGGGMQAQQYASQTQGMGGNMQQPYIQKHMSTGGMQGPYVQMQMSGGGAVPLPARIPGLSAGGGRQPSPDPGLRFALGGQPPQLPAGADQQQLQQQRNWPGADRNLGISYLAAGAWQPSPSQYTWQQSGGGGHEPQGPPPPSPPRVAAPGPRAVQHGLGMVSLDAGGLPPVRAMAMPADGSSLPAPAQATAHMSPGTDRSAPQAAAGMASQGGSNAAEQRAMMAAPPPPGPSPPAPRPAAQAPPAPPPPPPPRPAAPGPSGPKAGGGPPPPPPPGPPPPPPPFAVSKGLVIKSKGADTSTSCSVGSSISIPSVGAYNSLVDSIKALGASGAHRGHLRSLSKSKAKRGSKGTQQQQPGGSQQQQQGLLTDSQAGAGSSSGASTVRSSTSYGMLTARESAAAQNRGSLQALQFMQRLRSAMRPQQVEEEDEGEDEESSDDGWT